MKPTRINKQLEIFPRQLQIGITKVGYESELNGKAYHIKTIYLSKKEAKEIAKWILKNIDKKY